MIFNLQLDDGECDTVLAGLRLLQHCMAVGAIPPAIRQEIADVASGDGAHKPLDDELIELLIHEITEVSE